MASGGRIAPAPTSGRTPWGTISREQIVDAATRAVRVKGGFEQMTIRSLAADLGVAPMSLYRHVRDKDDLLDEVVDRLLARVWQPRINASDWKAWVAEAAERLRRFLVGQPAALHVFLSHPVVTPNALTRMDAVMDVLRIGLADEAAARDAYAAVHTYTIGFAALEASRRAGRPAYGPLPDRPDLSAQLAGHATPRQFAQGLRYLLDGIEVDGARQPGRTTGNGDARRQ